MKTTTTTLLLLSALAISTSLACDLKGDIEGVFDFADYWVNGDDKWLQVAYYLETSDVAIEEDQCTQLWWKEGEDWDTEIFTYKYNNQESWSSTMSYESNGDSKWTNKDFTQTWVYVDQDKDIFGYVESWNDLSYNGFRVIAKDWEKVTDDDIKKAFDAAKDAGICDAQRPLRNTIKKNGCQYF